MSCFSSSEIRFTLKGINVFYIERLVNNLPLLGYANNLDSHSKTLITVISDLIKSKKRLHSYFIHFT